MKLQFGWRQVGGRNGASRGPALTLRTFTGNERPPVALGGATYSDDTIVVWSESDDTTSLIRAQPIGAAHRAGDVLEIGTYVADGQRVKAVPTPDGVLLVYAGARLGTHESHALATRLHCAQR